MMMQYVIMGFGFVLAALSVRVVFLELQNALFNLPTGSLLNSSSEHNRCIGSMRWCGSNENKVDAGNQKYSQHIKPALIPFEQDTKECMDDEKIVLDHFPFKIGRERHRSMSHGQPIARKLKVMLCRPENDVYISDYGSSRQISRKHFQIEQSDDGHFEIVDRGSSCGTIVGTQVIGRHHKGGRCRLENGDQIIVGSSFSPHVFIFQAA